MANNIGRASKYIKLLDKVYKRGSLTSVLDVAPALVKAAEEAGTFYVQTLALVGLGDYSKTNGPPAGDVTAAWVAHTYDEDRGRKFTVDAANDLEAMGVFGNIAGEFLRRYVTPEIDAYRMATIATAAGTDVAADLSTAADWVSALNTGMNTLDEAEVPDGNKVLFITPTGSRLIRNAATTAATTDALDRCQVVEIPQARFYTAIDLNAGATGSAGGYTKNSLAENINFMIMDKGSCFADAKHTSIKTITPEVNQTSDSYVYHYRIYHDAFVYGQRVDGIYVHTSAEVS